MASEAPEKSRAVSLLSPRPPDNRGPREITLMTTLSLVYAVAAVVLFGIFAGIPMWMIGRHPDTAPDSKLPGYLLADWENLPVRTADAGHRRGR